MKRCKFYKTAHRYADGALPSAESVIFEEHMENCTRCGFLVDDLAKLTNIFEEKPAIQSDEDLKKRILKTLTIRSDTEKVLFHNDSLIAFCKRLVPVSACCSVVLLSVLFCELSIQQNRLSTPSHNKHVKRETGTDLQKYYSTAMSDAEREIIYADDGRAKERFYKMTMVVR